MCFSSPALWQALTKFPTLFVSFPWDGSELGQAIRIGFGGLVSEPVEVGLPVWPALRCRGGATAGRNIRGRKPGDGDGGDKIMAGQDHSGQ